MRLGEMLLRDGRLTEAQLKQALTAQARDGGRLGTVLFEHGLVDLEALTVYLGLELGIPIATGAMLERATRAAVRLLLPAAASPVSAPGPRPKLRSTKLAQMFDDSESLELDAEDLLESLDADDAAPAERATTVRPHRSTTPPIAESVTEPPRKALAADDALAALATVTDRDAMIDALLGYAVGAFRGAVLFTVRDQLAFGWKAVGDLPGRAYVEHLLIPLDATSIIQTAVAAESGVFSGEVAPSTVNSYLHKVLGIAEPKTATACVLTIGKRVVNVLYGYGDELGSDAIEELRQVCAVAAEAYARLIAVRKKK